VCPSNLIDAHGDWTTSTEAERECGDGMSARRLPLLTLVAANTASQPGNVVAVVALPRFVFDPSSRLVGAGA
jgi:hypothetical protein